MIDLFKEVQHVRENGPGAAAKDVVELQLERVFVPCLQKYSSVPYEMYNNMPKKDVAMWMGWVEV